MPVTHEVASSSLVVPAIIKEPFEGSFFVFKRLGSSRLSWICSTLTEFRFKHFVQVRSICSLSGLASVRKSARQSRHLKRLSFIDGLFYCKKGTYSALLACLAKAQNLNIQIVNETLKYS